MEVKRRDARQRRRRRVPRPPAARPRHAARRARGRRAREARRGAASSPRRSTRPPRWARRQRDLPAHVRARLLRDRVMSHVGARMDIARFGFEAARASPAPGRPDLPVRPHLDQDGAGHPAHLRPDARAASWVIAMGACSSSMGVFNNYAIVPGDKFLPVDVHVPGCPPRPGGARPRHPQAARGDPGAARRGLAHALRRARDRGGRHRRTTLDPTRSTSPAAAGRARVPDATGLELIAQELRDRDGDAVLDTVFFREQGAAARRRPARVPATLEHLRGQGLQLPRLRARRRLLPRGAAPRRALRAARHARGRPHHRAHARAAPTRRTCRRVTPDWPTADHQEREVYDMFGVIFDGHPTCAGSSCPRTTRATRSAATSRSAASRSSSPTTSATCRGGGSERHRHAAHAADPLPRDGGVARALPHRAPRARRAADAQHRPAPPRHARRAAAAEHARGRGRPRHQADHRLRPHRHREDRRGQGVLEGHPDRRADGLPRVLLQRDGVLRGGRDAARPRGPAARAVPARDPPGAQPDHVPPRVARDQRARPRRDLDVLVLLPRPRADPRPVRDVVRPAHAHALHPGRRRLRGHPASASRRSSSEFTDDHARAHRPVRRAARQERDRPPAPARTSPRSTRRRCSPSA